MLEMRCHNNITCTIKLARIAIKCVVLFTIRTIVNLALAMTPDMEGLPEALSFDI